MAAPALNYHHLQYFWMVAREGSIVRACERLHLSQPTISTQLQMLERSLGGKLFERSGRGLKLTELGHTVYRYADEIFTLGQEMFDSVQGRPTGRPLKLCVGISDVLAKLVVYRLLRPALQLAEPVRLVCREGRFDELLSELATYDLDLILSDSPVHSGSHIRAFNHLLGECGTSFFASSDLAHRYGSNLFQALEQVPLLLPTSNTQLRRSLDHWFDEQGQRPNIAGEFQDSALMKVFGQEGLGVFPGPTVVEDEICRQYDVQVVGRIHDVRERFYAVSVERRLKNPATIEIFNVAKTQIFGANQQPPPHDASPSGA